MPIARILDWHQDDSQIRSYVAPTNPYLSHQGVQATQKTNGKGFDLLEEFDKGMKVIESWNVGDEAE